MTKAAATFQFERATKNKYRFREDSDDPIVGTLYLDKGLFKDGAPDRITATFEW